MVEHWGSARPLCLSRELGLLETYRRRSSRTRGRNCNSAPTRAPDSGPRLYQSQLGCATCGSKLPGASLLMIKYGNWADVCMRTTHSSRPPLRPLDAGPTLDEPELPSPALLLACGVSPRGALYWDRRPSSRELGHGLRGPGARSPGSGQFSGVWLVEAGLEVGSAVWSIYQL